MYNILFILEKLTHFIIVLNFTSNFARENAPVFYQHAYKGGFLKIRKKRKSTVAHKCNVQKKHSRDQHL